MRHRSRPLDFQPPLHQPTFNLTHYPIVYGFCGCTPLWAMAILDDLQARFKLPVDIRNSFLAVGFRPAERLVGKPINEVLTAATLNYMSDLAPGQMTDALFDLRRD